MGRFIRVAGETFGVVVVWIVTPDVLVCVVARQAPNLRGFKAAAFHQPERLKADIIGIGLLPRRYHAMAFPAKTNLRLGAQFAGIEWPLFGIGGMLIRPGMAAQALDSGNHRIEISRDHCGMTAQTVLEVGLTLVETQCGFRTGGRARFLPYGHTVLAQPGEITDPRLGHARARAHQRSLALGSGAHHPLNHALGAEVALRRGDKRASRSAEVDERIPVR